MIIFILQKKCSSFNKSIFPAYLIVNFGIVLHLFEAFVGLAVGYVGDSHAVMLFYQSFSIWEIIDTNTLSSESICVFFLIYAVYFSLEAKELLYSVH